MEEYERKRRREREKHERQQSVSADSVHTLFSGPRRVNPSEGDDDITAKLGEYSTVKEFINIDTVGISYNSHRGGGGGGGVVGISSSSMQQRLPPPQPPHFLQQQPRQQTSYMKQPENKQLPPYNGRVTYPASAGIHQRSNSGGGGGGGGMAPPKGLPPALLSSSSSLLASQNQQQLPISSSVPMSSTSLLPPSSSVMPNGRLGQSTSTTTHNGRVRSQNDFTKPSIPAITTIPNNDSDIGKIIGSVLDKYKVPSQITQIAATPHTTIMSENYNLNGPNKNKYSFNLPTPLAPLELLTPIEPLASPPSLLVEPFLEPPLVSAQPTAIASALNPLPLVAASSSADLLRPEEPLPSLDKEMKSEKAAPELQKQNSSTLENDLELSESDDDHKKISRSSDSSQTDSSESGSDEETEQRHYSSQQQPQHQQQQQLLQSHLHQHPSSLHLAASSSSSQIQRQMGNSGASITAVAASTATTKNKKISQTITASGGNTISGILSNSGLGSAGSSSGPSSTSSNKTPSPSDSNKWNLSRYFNKAPTQQTQNDVAPSSLVVNSMNVSMNVPTMLPGGAQIIPEPAPQQMTIVKNEMFNKNNMEDDDDDDDEICAAGNGMETIVTGGIGVGSSTFRHPATLLDDIKKESDSSPLLAKQVPVLNASECVAIPTNQIKHESATSGSTHTFGGSKRSPTTGNNDISDRFPRLSSDSNSSDEDEGIVSVVPVLSPGGATLQIPGVPAAITALPRSPPSAPHQQTKMLQPLVPNSLTVTAIDPLPSTPPKQKIKKPRKKLKAPPASLNCTLDSSDEEDNCSSAMVNPVAAASARGTVVGKLIAENPSTAASAKKGRGRPRKNTPHSQSGNVSSASASSNAKGPTLTAKKDVTKKPTARRRMSRQNSLLPTAAVAVVAAVSTKISPTKLNISKQAGLMPQQRHSAAAANANAAAAVPIASSADSSASSSSSSSSSSSGSEEASSSEDEQKSTHKRQILTNITAPVAVAPSSTLNNASTGGRRIVKQFFNKRKASLDDIVGPSVKATSTVKKCTATQQPIETSDSEESSSNDSSAEIYPAAAMAHAANELSASASVMSAKQHTPGGSSSHRSQNQQSPFKANVSASSSSASTSTSSSSSSSGDDEDDEEHSDSDCDISAAPKEKKLRRDKPKSDKNKINTLTRIFNPKEGGAKKQGQVVIIDQSEDLLAKEQHHQQQQQQHQHQKHFSPNAAFKTSQENLAPATSSFASSSAAVTASAAQLPATAPSPRLTPSHIKSPRIVLASHRTPDRSSSSAERKLQQRIKTPTRTPTRTPPTPTPTQPQHLAASSAFTPAQLATMFGAPKSCVCSIDLSRLNINPEWSRNQQNTRGSVSHTPASAVHAASTGLLYNNHEQILNADLQATTAKLKFSRGGTRAGSHTPTQVAAISLSSDNERSRSRESLSDVAGNGSKQPRLDYTNSNGRLSSRSADGASTPKELLVQPPPPSPSFPSHLTPNGYTSRGTAGPTGSGNSSPAVTHPKLIAGLKHEQHIKNEPDLDAVFCNDTKIKSGGCALAVKQEMLIKNDCKANELCLLTEKQISNSPASAASVESKPRRKRSSSSSSSPYKEKRRKKEKDSSLSAALTVAAVLGVGKEKERDTLKATEIATQNAHAQLSEQLPPTNHDRLLARQQTSHHHNHQNSSSPALVPMQPTSTTATMPPPIVGSCGVGVGGGPGIASSQLSASQLPTKLVDTTVARPIIMYRSTFEKDSEPLSDDFTKNTKFLQEAVDRKHAADRETNTFNQVTLYLEAVVYFLLTAAAMEQHRNSEEASWTMYKDTLALIKFISSKFRHLQVSSADGSHETHNRVAILSLRCQSLISLKLVKMRRQFCRNVINVCTEYFKNGKGDIVNGNTPSSNSPSNSVCSQGSGSNTPPARIVPPDVYVSLHQQHQYFSYYQIAHDLWEQADKMVRQGQHTQFFIELDREDGPLTLLSSMQEVFKYVQAGLRKLKEEMSIE